MKASGIKYGIVLAALYPVALLPLRVLYVFGAVLSFIMHRVVRYRVKVVRKNLKLCFPDKSAQELRHIEKKFYSYFGDIIVETVKLLHISDSQIKKRVEIRNSEVVEEISDSERPIILFLAHYCNWEWVPAITMKLSRPKTMGALYKPLRNKTMDRVMLKLRSRFPLRCISVRNAYRTLLEMRSESPSFMIGFIADQRALGGNLKHWTTFMGQETSYFAGGETIGNRVNAAYVYLDIERPKRGHYVITFKPVVPPADDNGDFPYTRQYFRMLEKTIRRSPEYWLWSHNRWKKPKGKEV